MPIASLQIPAIHEKDQLRFWSKVNIAGEDECWEWKASKVDGYGRIGISGRLWLSHRVAFTIKHGEIEDGMLVLHDCDNRGCCNPKHLFVGLNENNSDDKVKKGRHAKGERIPTSVVDAGEVVELREAHNAGESTMAALASRFGLSDSQTYRIINRRSWKHIP